AASAGAVPIHTGRDTGNDAGFHFRRLTDLNKSPAGSGIGERKPRAATGAGHDRRQRRAPAASLCFLFALAATLCFWPAGWRRAAIIASQAFLSPQCHFMLPLTATLWVKAHILRCSLGEYPIGGCEDFRDVVRCGLGQETPETVEGIAPIPAQPPQRCRKRRWIASAHATRRQFPRSRR